MAEVYFYHLTSSPLEQALPDLLEKVRGNDWRALIRCTDQTRLNKMRIGDTGMAADITGGSLVSNQKKNKRKA